MGVTCLNNVVSWLDANHTMLIQRVTVLIETVDTETGRVISAENHPREFPCPSLTSSGGDEVNVTTLGRVVAATAAALATELQERLLNGASIG